MTPSVLLRILRDPHQAATLSSIEWDLLLRLARHGKLLARLGIRITELGLEDKCPDKALDNMRGAKAYSDFYQAQASWELRHLKRALADTGSPILLLKGAAYLISQLPPNGGRMLSDVDLLIPREKLPQVEQHLQDQGWQSETQNEYDQHYYREWMHEIPPLRHKNRGFEVDIHHNLLPLVGRLRPNADLLWQAAQPIGNSGFLMLSPADMVLHSAAHLFFSDELRGGLRDLVDIHDLCLHFSQQDHTFWGNLVPRSRKMDLSRPLYYALHAARHLLETPVPNDVLNPDNYDAPGLVTGKVMQQLITLVLEPHLPDDSSAAFAQWLLYARSHWVRMPIDILVPHLFHKAFISPCGKGKE